MKRPEPSWHDKYYRRLEGAKILAFHRGSGDSDTGASQDAGFPRFTVRLTSGEKFDIEISGDEEGNHGGFIFGLPVVEDAQKGYPH